MSEFDNNQNGTDEEMQQQDQQSVPEPQQEQTPESSNEPSNETSEPRTWQESEDTGALRYVWDGSKPSKHKGGRKSAVFCAVAVVCLLLTVAVCLPTILYAMQDGNGTSNTSGAGSLAGLSEVNAESQRDVSQTVRPSESNDLVPTELEELYERCSVSAVSIYVTYGSRSNGYAIGSGFVLTEDGYIATNHHVVEDGEEFTVIFYDGEEYSAELIGSDSIRDLAVLKIKAKNLTPMPIGESSSLRIGQSVVAIGTPYDLVLAGTMTKGIISGVNRKIELADDSGRVTKTMRLIQTDASINPGNSGGPLLNMAGQVIGINTLKLADEFEGTGFAIPIDSAIDIFNQIIQYGEVVQDPPNEFVEANARLGVSIYDVVRGLSALRIRPRCEYPTEGVLVASIEPNTAAYEAGLQMYDIITEFDGVKIANTEDLTNELAKHRAGEQITLRVFSFSRDFSEGSYKTLTFRLDSAA